ncbi:hypothetical protein T439DRAFT_352736 [Meredithblackwellia eburnea MCA 4105]
MDYDYGYDVDGDGYLDTFVDDGLGLGYDTMDNMGLGGGYDDIYMYGGGYDGGYLDDGGIGLSSYDTGYGEDYLEFLDHDVPLFDAWGSYGDSGWADEQYALGDLLYYQQQLQLDRALTEQERLARWEERLAWEELDDAQRRARYLSMDPYSLRRLGLYDGWYGRQLGGRDVDMSYLRGVNLSRGLFSSPYRNVFSRHRGLQGRFASFWSPSRIRGYSGYGGRFGPGARSIGFGGVGIGVPYGSRPMAGELSARADQLRTRLRLAQARASMTGLSAELRARALEDARQIKSEINNELMQRRMIDRVEQQEDTALAAHEAVRERRELQRDIEAERDNARIDAIGAGGMAGQQLRIGGGFGARPVPIGASWFGGVRYTGAGAGIMRPRS